MPTEMPRPDGSLGLLYLAGALEREGIQADVLDASVGTTHDKLEDTFYKHVMQENGLIKIGLSENRLAEIIATGGYNVVCISSIFTPQTRMALMVARVTKRVSPEILVIAGGVNARSLPERFLKGGVDVICATEGEAVVVAIVRAFEKHESIAVAGTITIRDDGKIVRQPIAQRDLPSNLDDLPFPAWHKLPFEHYDVALSAGRGFLKSMDRSAGMMTSRGCPFKCAYCHVSVEKFHPSESGDIGRLRLKSEERVIAELEELKRLEVSKVFFEDDSLLAKKERVKRIFSTVRAMGMRLADVNGVNLVHFLKGGKGGRPVIDREFLELLYEAGLKEIVFPVESANQRVLDKYATGKLNHSILDVVELVKVAREVGITSPINMMVGFPDETEEEIRETIELGKRLVDSGAPYCSLYIPIPFPGSTLFTESLARGYLDHDFNPDDFNWRRAVMKNTTVSPKRVEELQSWGWRYANTDEYVEKRLSMNIGLRWKSGEPEN